MNDVSIDMNDEKAREILTCKSTLTDDIRRVDSFFLSSLMKLYLAEEQTSSSSTIDRDPSLQIERREKDKNERVLPVSLLTFTWPTLESRSSNKIVRPIQTKIARTIVMCRRLSRFNESLS